MRLEGLVAERDGWRRNAEEALAGLAVAIDRQLDAWRFTPAEREVVVALLKGKSHKEIAAASGRSERPVRQHAAAAYEKAGLGGPATPWAFPLLAVGPALGFVAIRVAAKRRVGPPGLSA